MLLFIELFAESIFPLRKVKPWKDVFVWGQQIKRLEIEPSFQFAFILFAQAQPKAILNRFESFLANTAKSQQVFAHKLKLFATEIFLQLLYLCRQLMMRLPLDLLQVAISLPV
jgi:hypothetical protein